MFFNLMKKKNDKHVYTRHRKSNVHFKNFKITINAFFIEVFITKNRNFNTYQQGTLEIM